MCESLRPSLYSLFFFFNDTATTEIYTLSLHDALPISPRGVHLVKTKSARLGSVPFPRSRHRDEKPVTANPTKSAVTNCDARNSFRIRFYENCRVTSFKPRIFLFPRRALSLLFSLFAPRAFRNSLPLKGIRTLSKNSRWYVVSSRSGTHIRPRIHLFFNHLNYGHFATPFF